ncbi:riboflavin kinase [Thraustotheca clavata]|uniref:riboflavin kinase n=1 Tax=Thraustotheca clavata TaxID=74557 RepID=A0A1V9ZFZ0_9STRA|nr:riboflavin kinase [Thraustotheca clavata]
MIKPVEVIRLSATVVAGFGRGGKQLGCPTANMCPKDLGDALHDTPTGIYCGWATVDGQGPYMAVASVGWNPTFKNTEKTIEPHLLHTFESDFYGSKINLVLCGYIRPELPFTTLDDLIAAIQSDIALSRKWLETEEAEALKDEAFLAQY